MAGVMDAARSGDERLSKHDSKTALRKTPSYLIILRAQPRWPRFMLSLVVRLPYRHFWAAHYNDVVEQKRTNSEW